LGFVFFNVFNLNLVIALAVLALFNVLISRRLLERAAAKNFVNNKTLLLVFFINFFIFKVFIARPAIVALGIIIFLLRVVYIICRILRTPALVCVYLAARVKASLIDIVIMLLTVVLIVVELLFINMHFILSAAVSCLPIVVVLAILIHKIFYLFDSVLLAILVRLEGYLFSAGAIAKSMFYITRAHNTFNKFLCLLDVEYCLIMSRYTHALLNQHAELMDKFYAVVSHIKITARD